MPSLDLHSPVLWLAAGALGLAFALAGAAWGWWHARRHANELPQHWTLAARPVFSADERRVFRLLREALPHHVVLSKLPLVRFCQPTEASEVSYWYALLGSAHVTFAVCSPNGRVLAAIDLDSERGQSMRGLQIKNAVLDACRVRYLRVAMDHLPSVAELQLLVPQSAQARGPQPAPAHAASSTASTAPRRSREEDPGLAGSDWGEFSQPLPLWRDASVFQEPNFGAEPAAFAARQRQRGPHAAVDDEGLDDIVGVLVEPPPRLAKPAAPRARR